MYKLTIVSLYIKESSFTEPLRGLHAALAFVYLEVAQIEKSKRRWELVNANRDPSADEISAELPREDELTRGEKSWRDKACYLIVQPLWLLLHLPRFLLAGIVWLAWGKAAAHWAWRKIFTPANFLTTARFVLWGKAIMLFLAGAPLVEQTHWLFFALATDFFDGPMARLNGEVTELGTYLDHGGDWGVTLWVVFLSLWYGTLELPFLLAALGATLLLFAVNGAKFLKFYDPEASFWENVGAFAVEELQTDFWGRVQFVSLAAALFGGVPLKAVTGPRRKRWSAT